MDTPNSNSQNTQVVAVEDNTKKDIVEVGLEKQLEYIKIHHLKVVCQLTPQEISKEYNISTQKVYHACRWVRDNWEVLNTQEYLADAERLIGTRIREYDEMIEVAKKGEVILIDGHPLTDKEGKQLMKINMQFIREVMRDRREYERMLLEVRGLFQKTQIIMGDNKHITGNVTINTAVEFSSKVSQEDKAKLIEICEKYGQHPE